MGIYRVYCPGEVRFSSLLFSLPMSRVMANTVRLHSPKLLVHVFIGSRLALLAEKGDKMSGRDKAINYLSMIIGAAVGLSVGWIIYRRTMARAAEISLETAAEEGAILRPEPDICDDDGDDDSDARMIDPEDAAAIMADDDISLWEASANLGTAQYRDEDDEGSAEGLGIRNGDLEGGSGRTSRASSKQNGRV